MADVGDSYGWLTFIWCFIQCRVPCDVFIQQYEGNVRNITINSVFLTFLSYCYVKTPHGTRHWIKHHTKSTTHSYHRHLPFLTDFNSSVITLFYLEKWMY